MRGNHGFTLVEIMIVVAIIGLLAAIAIPSFVKARQDSQAKACSNNMRIMDSAKEQACMEYKWGPTQAIQVGTIQETNVWQYIKGNKTPLCPGGGSYAWNVMGVAPSCTMSNVGHIYK